MDTSDGLQMTWLPPDIMQLILRRACVCNPIHIKYYTKNCEWINNFGISDLFTVCKYWNTCLSQIFARKFRRTFECKVCHVGNNDIRCNCEHSIQYHNYELFGGYHTYWHYTRTHDSKTSDYRHRWNPLICRPETTHSQNCTLDKYILSLDGVCVPCLHYAVQLRCGKCNIKFMSTYKGNKPLCPRCLDGNTTKEIALPWDLPWLKPILCKPQIVEPPLQ